jgi:hypothetical protein
MGRIHLFEFEDQRWFPTFIRNYGTDFLQFISEKTKAYEHILPVIKKGINENDDNKIVDLCSGGGGGLVWINEELKKDNLKLNILLTDYYPNISTFEHIKKQSSNFDFIETPVDARNVPKELRGLRTQFLSFHHFKPADAKKILQNAIDSHSPIAIFEIWERSFLNLFMMLYSPLSVILVTPFIRPFRLGRIIFTFLIPIVPLFIWWDGMVSILRTYSVKEMNNLVVSLNNHENFNWEFGRLKSRPGKVLYLLGTVKK